MAQEFCPQCGEPRNAEMRYCRRCRFDFSTAQAGIEPRAAWVAPGAQPGPTRPARKHPRLTAGLAILAGVMLLAFYLSGQGGTGGFGGSPSVTVTYKLTGTATHALSVTYTDSSGNIQQATNVDVPLTRTSGETGITVRVARGTFVAFNAQNGGASGDLTCSIEADGTVINTGHAQGGYAIVSCSARVP